MQAADPLLLHMARKGESGKPTTYGRVESTKSEGKSRDETKETEKGEDNSASAPKETERKEKGPTMELPNTIADKKSKYTKQEDTA